MIKHGFAGTTFYATWMRIYRVCNKRSSEKYRYYGGRGIKCLWESFEEFKNDMHESYLKHLKIYGRLNTTIERTDNNGSYCKENCKWATRKEQSSNRRTRVEITFNGQTHSVTEWSEIIRIPKTALWFRLFRRRWSIQKALITPLAERHKKQAE